jgi:hypothetical protein
MIRSPLWRAVGRDDSAAAGRLMSSAWSDADRTHPRLAAAYREARELRPEAMAHDGAMDEVEVLAVDRLRFYFTSVGTGVTTAGVPIVVSRLELLLEDGDWRVDRTSDREPIGRLRLGEARPAALSRARSGHADGGAARHIPCGHGRSTHRRVAGSSRRSPTGSTIRYVPGGSE